MANIYSLPIPPDYIPCHACGIAFARKELRNHIPFPNPEWATRVNVGVIMTLCPQCHNSMHAKEEVLRRDIERNRALNNLPSNAQGMERKYFD